MLAARRVRPAAVRRLAAAFRAPSAAVSVAFAARGPAAHAAAAQAARFLSSDSEQRRPAQAEKEEDEDEGEEQDVAVNHECSLDYASFDKDAEPLPWGFIPQEEVNQLERRLRENQHEAVVKMALSYFFNPGNPMPVESGPLPVEMEVSFGTMQVYRVAAALFANRNLVEEEAAAIEAIEVERLEQEEAEAEKEADTDKEADKADTKEEEAAEVVEEEDAAAHKEPSARLAELIKTPPMSQRAKINLLDCGDWMDEGVATLLEMQREQYAQRGLVPELVLDDSKLEAEVLGVRTAQAPESEEEAAAGPLGFDVLGPVEVLRGVVVDRKAEIYVDVGIFSRERLATLPEGKDEEAPAGEGEDRRVVPASHVLTLRGVLRNGEPHFFLHNINGVLDEPHVSPLFFRK